MTSDNAESPNVADETGNRKTGLPVIGARCHPDTLRMIDVAASFEGETRSEFLVASASARARRVLQEKAPEALVHFPAA